MPYRGRMARNAREQYGEELDTLIPRWLTEGLKPGAIARRLDVETNSARSWLMTHGYTYDEHTGTWVKGARDVA